MPLPDTDRCFKTLTGWRHIRWGWDFEEEEACPVQRWAQQRAHRTRQRAECSVHARPMDNVSGHAVALQVLPVHGHVCRDLVPVWGTVVSGGPGAR